MIVTKLHQRYRGWFIRRTFAGYSVERPNGAHVATAVNYSEAIQIIDSALNEVTA